MNYELLKIDYTLFISSPLFFQAQSTGGEDQDSSWNPSHVGDGSVRPNDGNGGAPLASEDGNITRLASIDSFDSKWWVAYSFFGCSLSCNWNSLLWLLNRKQFLEPGESVLMISMVKKLQKLTNKKVQLILTNKPKLIYVDPAKLVVKGNIIWSDNPNDLSIQVLSPSNFKICTVSHASSHPTILLQSLFS